MQIDTARLRIRPFQPDDLETIDAILRRAFGKDGTTLAERRAWLTWSALNQEWLPRLHQLPSGDLAVTLRESGELIGSVGLVPLLDVYGQIPGLGSGAQSESGLTTSEVGLFWAIDEPQRGRGYATEVGRAMIDFAFTTLRLRRILATTEYNNLASQAVMTKLGMRLLRNPHPEPEHLQIVGLLENFAPGTETINL